MSLSLSLDEIDGRYHIEWPSAHLYDYEPRR